MRIGYARVSTEEQNLGLQIDALNTAGCVEIFCDEGISAVAGDRPEFEAALELLGAGDTLVIWKMDRAFRSLFHALHVLEELETRDVRFHSLTDAIDTATPIGRFTFQITNAFAELERAMIVERTRAGIEAARRRGANIGRPLKLTEQQIHHAVVALSSDDKTLTCLASQYGVAPRTLSRALSRFTTATQDTMGSE